MCAVHVYVYLCVVSVVFVYVHAQYVHARVPNYMATLSDVCVYFRVCVCVCVCVCVLSTHAHSMHMDVYLCVPSYSSNLSTSVLLYI